MSHSSIYISIIGLHGFLLSSKASDKSCDFLTAAGYRALFITVDAPVLGKRVNERSGVKFELPEGMHLPNLSSPSNDEASGPSSHVRSYKFSGRDPSNSWESVIPWVKANTKLEIWLKGSECRAQNEGLQ